MATVDRLQPPTRHARLFTGIGAVVLAVTTLFTAAGPAPADTVTDTVAVGREPRGVAITPDGSRAYVTNERDSTVSVIDTATDKLIGDPIDVPFPNSVAITPDGKRAFVTSVFDTVSVIDTATDKVVGAPIEVDRPRAIPAILGGDQPGRHPRLRHQRARRRHGIGDRHHHDPAYRHRQDDFRWSE